MKNARSWIPQLSIVCSLNSFNKNGCQWRHTQTSLDVVSQCLQESTDRHLVGLWKEPSTQLARFEVQFYVVILGMREKTLEMALHCSFLVF